MTATYPAFIIPSNSGQGCGSEGIMANDDNAAVELYEDAPVMLVDGKPVPLSAIQLVDGVFVDEAGRPVAVVKPQTWY